MKISSNFNSELENIKRNKTLILSDKSSKNEILNNTSSKIKLQF